MRQEDREIVRAVVRERDPHSVSPDEVEGIDVILKSQGISESYLEIIENAEILDSVAPSAVAVD